MSLRCLFDQQFRCGRKHLRNHFGAALLASSRVRDKFGLTPEDYVSDPYRRLPEDHGVEDEPGHRARLVNTLRDGDTLAYEKYVEAGSRMYMYVPYCHSSESKSRPLRTGY